MDVGGKAEQVITKTVPTVPDGGSDTHTASAAARVVDDGTATSAIRKRTVANTNKMRFIVCLLELVCCNYVRGVCSSATI
jgi:hypothetical protein